MLRGGLSGVAIALVLSAAAHAAVAPVEATDRLTVRVAGRISARCALQQTGPAQASFGDILDQRTGAATANVLELPVSLDCNAPYRATLSSSRGALTYTGAATPGFASTVSYRAEFGLAQGGGVRLDCKSADMRARAAGAADGASGGCTAATTEEVQTATTGRVRLTLDAGGSPLLKGTYSDDITLRIAPNVSGEG